MERKEYRICVYPKDVSRLTGKGLRHSQKLLQTIKDAYKKEKHQFITINEFVEFTGIEIAFILDT